MQPQVERIIDEPLASRSDRVKLNHIYIWAGAHTELLMEAWLNKDPNSAPRPVSFSL